jgi:uncharacterized protein DUF6338
MIPQTLGSLLAFLGLIAPGLLFELRRERRRPIIEETAFREASRVALTSLAFTLSSLALLAVVRARRPELMPDPGAWLEQGHRYVNEHYRLIARTFLIEIAIAAALALLADWLLSGTARGRIVPGSLWFHLLRMQRPENTVPWIHARLKDETEFWGYLGDYTPEEKLENRELSIVGPKLQMRRKGETTNTLLDTWASVAVRGDEINFLRITYVDTKTGQVKSPAPSTGTSLLAKLRRAGSSRSAAE